MTDDYSNNILLIEAPPPTLAAIKAELDGEQLGATDRLPLEVRDLGAAGLHVRYRVDGDVGVDPVDSLARRWPDATFTLTFDYDDQDWSGFARWAGGVFVALESDDPTLDANHDELHREAILLEGLGGDWDAAVVQPSRWAAACGLARRHGWRPEPWILRAMVSPPEPPDGVPDEAYPCGHVRLEVVVVPGDEARRLAAALDAAIATYGVPASLREGVRGAGTASGEGAAADPLDRATPRVVRAVRDLARVGAELRVSRLIRSGRPIS